jgi:hypothetical protein
MDITNRIVARTALIISFHFGPPDGDLPSQVEREV